MDADGKNRPGFIRRSIYRVGDAAAGPSVDPREIAREVLQQHQAQRKRTIRIYGIYLFLAVAVVGLGVLGFVHYQQQKSISILPPAIRAAIDFPVYLPEPLMSGAQTADFKYTADTLLFTTSHKGSDVIITEQKLPPNFELDNFSKSQGLSEVRQSTTDEGKFLSGNLKGRPIIIYTTRHTLITITNTSASSSSPEDIVFTLKKL